MKFSFSEIHKYFVISIDLFKKEKKSQKRRNPLQKENCKMTGSQGYGIIWTEIMQRTAEF